jgi:hypothetical protein
MDGNDLCVRRLKPVSPSSPWTSPSKWLLKIVWIVSRSAFPKDRNVSSDNTLYTRIEKVWRCKIRRVGRMGCDSQRILWAKFMRLPGYMGSDIVCMNDATMTNRFRRQFKNWLQNIFDIMGRIKRLSFWKDFDGVKLKWIHVIVTIIFLVRIMCFLLSEVVRHPATRWFRNLSINKTTTHQGWRNIATLSAQPNGGLSRVRLISVPLLPVLRCAVCEGPMKMLHDKANRACQSPSHCSCRNERSLRYLMHWWEWLFIKRCPNCLINNV